MEEPEKYQGEAVPTHHDVEPGVIISSDVRRRNRIPPGQTRTRKWPVLDAFGTPAVPLDRWQLDIFGLVDHPQRFTLEQFRELPRVKVFSDFHCVTRWSRLGNLWEGVSTAELLRRAGIQEKAKYVLLHGYDNGWTTNLPLADFLSDDALLADTHDGLPISADHGGPVRAIVPLLYAWKSAKWIRAIELIDFNRPGYWERGGYHMRGDPWTTNSLHPDGERYRDD